MAGGERRCRTHQPLPCGGVCPHCLRDRLLRLCPDCACWRPCACGVCAVASPSSSTSSGGSALGRVHSLVVERSRSVAAAASGGGGGGNDDDDRPKSRVWGWVSFRKPADRAAGCRDVEEEYDDAVALARSTSVSVSATADEAKKASRWGRLIPGKIKALRRRKSSVVR